MASSHLPEEIEHNILTRLPVKTLLRFKSVCKTWQAIITSPKFIQTQITHNSLSPNKNSLLVYTSPYFKKFSIISLIDRPETNQLNLKHVGFIGSINGLVCLSL